MKRSRDVCSVLDWVSDLPGICPFAATSADMRYVGMNCEKNAVVCEGYPEKQIWKSGKEKAAEGVFWYWDWTTRYILAANSIAQVICNIQILYRL